MDAHRCDPPNLSWLAAMALHAPEAFALLQMLVALDRPVAAGPLAEALQVEPLALLMSAQRLRCLGVELVERPDGLALADDARCALGAAQLGGLADALRARLDAVLPAILAPSPAPAQSRVDGALLLAAPRLPAVDAPAGGIDGGLTLADLSADAWAIDPVWLRPAR